MPNPLTTEYHHLSLDVTDLAVAHYLVRQLGYLVAHSTTLQHALAAELNDLLAQRAEFYSRNELRLFSAIAGALATQE
jgi:hypothetical protein